MDTTTFQMILMMVMILSGFGLIDDAKGKQLSPSLVVMFIASVIAYFASVLWL